jgi:hypothetical protein
MYLKCIQREMYLIRRRHAGYMQDTYNIQDTCGIHVSSVAIKIQSRYILDPCKIHAGYMRDTYLGGWGNVYERDTSRYMRDTCTIHARYMGYVS